MTDTAYAPAAQEPQAAPGSFVRRVADTFLSPIALFGRFGARPPWVDVTVLSVVIMAGAIAMVPESVYLETMREAVRQQGQQMTPAMEGMAGMQRVFALGATVVMPWIALVISAGLLTLIFSVLMGGKATFRQHVSVMAHAGLIGAVGLWARLPVILQKRDMQAGISLAALAPSAEPGSFTYKFLNAWDVFTIWQYVVIAFGVAIVGRRTGVGTAVAVILGLYALVMAGIASF
ncbi:YIP1 family protein [Longimicrobium terrae]|uniref:Yip1 domain-containing protein n=1 Tax=Longimicrobium terrae TaxID=1639882 RepID=A0A841GXF3_9BACT|nr:YIP1 family protein [Longimicrobium terrae]MBB4635820.1 hypothetical protein [Longimicrobium terrae]MBB6070216.1 hypothetical protein [Longimicrobium terrae]NNC30722.1 hypothetical protein [Longimicrobium terrae]